MHMRLGLVLVTGLLLSHGAFAACKFSASRNVDVEATGIKKLIVEAGAGDLRINGVQGASRLHGVGEACANSQERLDAIRLEARRDGDTMFIRAVLNSDDSKRHRDWMDVSLDVPSTLQTNVDDSSGDLFITQVAGARVHDSSGDQVIRDIEGHVEVTDSSGDVEIKNVRGNVNVSDSSGDVVIADVNGNVSIPVDSSGGLSFRRIHGEVHIASDSSGDISIADVNKDVRIDHDSAGDIRVSGIAGNFAVEHDSTGDIEHRNVLGTVRLPRSKDHDD